LKYNMKSIVKELVEKKIAIKNEDNSVWIIFDDKLKIPSCILQKRDWTHWYLASDLAAIKYRMDNWNPVKIVYFVDTRQSMHLKQVFTISKKVWWVKENTELFHANNWFISLKDGAMSTRRWRIIKLDALLDEAEERAKNIILEKRDDIVWVELYKIAKIIWIWAIKYGYLKKSRETDVIFDWDEFMSFEWNSGPFIQYAYVRAIRVLEKSSYSISLKWRKEATKWIFEYSDEIELIKAISNYFEALENTTKTNSPHILCKYSYELTKTFNTFYNNIHILSEEDENKKINRLKLVELFSEVLKDSFKMLGIEMPNKM
jgi:arginyl-tRNA synthetase